MLRNRKNCRILLLLGNGIILLGIFFFKITDIHGGVRVRNNVQIGYSSPDIVQVHDIAREAIPPRPISGHSGYNIFKYVMSVNACAPIDDVFECVNARFRHLSYPMCIYQTYEDAFISQGIINDGLWETGNVEKVVDELIKENNGNSSIGFIDVGANLGSFTLTAAHLGYRVVAVEPTPRSVRRLMSSVVRGQISSRVTVVAAAVSDERKTFYEKIDYSNMGRAQLVNETECRDPRWSMVADKVHGLFIPYKCDLNTPIKTIYLNDLIPLLPFDKIILKIDVEGHEYLALKKAAELFERRNIICVHMEWVFYKLMAENNHNATVGIVEGMIEFFLNRGYYPEYGYGGATISPRLWLQWPDDVTWRKYPPGKVPPLPEDKPVSAQTPTALPSAQVPPKTPPQIGQQARQKFVESINHRMDQMSHQAKKETQQQQQQYKLQPPVQHQQQNYQGVQQQNFQGIHQQHLPGVQQQHLPGVQEQNSQGVQQQNLQVQQERSHHQRQEHSQNLFQSKLSEQGRQQFQSNQANQGRQESFQQGIKPKLNVDVDDQGSLHRNTRKRPNHGQIKLDRIHVEGQKQLINNSNEQHVVFV